MSANNKGSVTIETALVLPVILFAIASFISITILTYKNNSDKISVHKKASDTSKREPLKVIDNTDLITGILKKAGNLVSALNKGGSSS